VPIQVSRELAQTCSTGRTSHNRREGVANLGLFRCAKLIPLANSPHTIRPLLEKPHNNDADLDSFVPMEGNDPYTPDKRRRNPGSLSGICATFNDDGTPTRDNSVGKETADSSWHPKTLIRILRDPRIAGYAAEIVYKTRPDGRKSSQVDRYKLIRDPETMEPLRPWPPILEPVEWHALQLWLDGRGRGQGLSRGTSLLGSMRVLYCESGDPMKSNNSPQISYRANYACTGTRRRARPGEHEGTCAVSQRALDGYLARRIMSLIATTDKDPDTLDILSEATRLFGISTQAPEMLNERAALVAERAPPLPISEWLGEPGTDPIGAGSWWASASRDDRRALVKLFVRRITVTKSEFRGQARRVEDRIHITWVRAGEETRD